jgi:2-succinyl-5-enolpyruvyl-6-hydroxy-3-cyclohexene-1-carboxylate synthase
VGTGAINLTWTRALVDELVRAGVRHVCVSPGSRSTPLALAVAERTDLTTSVHVDERSGGFFALGHGRATGRPAALVCTSGTAAANYLPAVIEAHYSRVPLIVLTADRPPELRDTGAWQTIDQVRLYGGYVRWFVDVATPSDDPGMLRYVRHVAARAVAVARSRPSGPVHLNLPFREPLAPAAEELARAGPGDGWGAPGRPDGAPLVDLAPVVVRAPDTVLDDLADTIAREPRGLILAGRIDAPAGYAGAIARLASVSGYPILAEATGGLRFGPHDRSHVVTAYDALLRSDSWSEAHRPELVIRFGASFTWRSVARFLEGSERATQAVVDPQVTWDDPTRLARLQLAVDPIPLCEALATLLAERIRSADGHEARTAWGTAWGTAEARANAVRDRYVAPVGPDGVGWVYAAILDALPDGAIVYVANSMAVRDLDTFTVGSERSVRVIANRGAAGIDGTISSALGSAYGSGTATVLVTGDLAFAHDIGGLGAAGLPGVDLTIVVLDDGGGGIFDFLPVADLDRRVFHRYFTTPSGLDVAAACAAYGVPHHTVSESSELTAALPGLGNQTSGVRVVQVSIDRAANTAFHRRYWSEVRAAVEG